MPQMSPMMWIFISVSMLLLLMTSMSMFFKKINNKKMIMKMTSKNTAWKW